MPYAVIDEHDVTQILGAASVNGALLFGFGVFQHGTQLWRSDGTPEGTLPLTTVGVGPIVDPDDAITQVWPTGRALFAGSDARGLQLWRTDGTAAGTGLLVDISAGTSSSSPSDFTVAGNSLFFTADDGVHGRELWALSRTQFNAAPVARDLSFSVGVGTTFSALLGGSDLDGQALTYRIVRGAGKGAVTLTDPSTGAFTYTPQADASGTDQFTYTAGDGLAESPEATVTLALGNASPSPAPPGERLYLPLLRP